MASGQLMNFILSLPEYAFNMAGDVAAEDRMLFSAAPPGTPSNMVSAYPRVMYRYGWKGQGDKITVSFMLPGSDIFSIAVAANFWGTLSAPLWRQMILRYLPLGVLEFPVQE